MVNEKCDVRATMASTALCFSGLARAVNGIFADKARHDAQAARSGDEKTPGMLPWIGNAGA
jgi:hypothetical protein